MFDAHHHHFNAVTKRVTENVNITEKRAPTDESVKLLREMEDRAQARIVASTRVADMGFECVIHKMEDLMNAQTRYAVIYSLNGKKHRVDHDVDDLGRSRHEQMQKTVDELRDVVAKDLALHLLAEAFRKVPQGF